MEHKTLSGLNNEIKTSLYKSFPDTVWVVAEISEIKINYSGHCYLELIEKDGNKNQILAKSRATIWAYVYRMLSAYFKDSTGYDLQEGLKVLLKANVEFHVLYGMSLNIVDIDPGYSLGDIEKQKQEVLNQLKDDGIIDLNKEIDLPVLPGKLAVISSETAAGYQDFCKQISQKGDQFNIGFELFPAVMQGDKASASIIAALDSIYTISNRYDAVVIIRGGGAKADMHCFNEYELAANIAQFPLPVLTGIGHEKDESIADIVANTKLKTPTAVADYICDKFSSQEAYIQDLSAIFSNTVQRIVFQAGNQLNNIKLKVAPLVNEKIHNKKIEIKDIIYQLNRSVKNITLEQSSLTDLHKQKLDNYINTIVSLEKQKLANFVNQINIKAIKFIREESTIIELMEERKKANDPVTVINKGYSVLSKNNRTIQSVNDIEINDKISIKIKDGKIDAVVTNK
jgi:exodeoxyribonuclease VII large subunit